MVVKTYRELQREVERRMQQALDNVIQVVYNKLLQFIQEDIYNTYSPKRYERTYEFKTKAWAYDSAKKVGNYIMAQINYRPDNMSIDPEKYQHSSPVGPSELQSLFGADKVVTDNRGQLAYILNAGASAKEMWNFGRPNMNDFVDTKPFWDDTLNWLSQNLNNLAIAEFKKVGLNLT